MFAMQLAPAVSRAVILCVTVFASVTFLLYFAIFFLWAFGVSTVNAPFALTVFINTDVKVNWLVHSSALRATYGLPTIFEYNDLKSEDLGNCSRQ
jgi:hypothetical protein